MAAAETARLIASLELQDKNFTRGIKRVEQGVGRVDKKLGAFSGFVNRNVGRALDSAALKLTQFVGTGLEELAQLEDGTTSVTGAINQVGKGWTTTADDIAGWANEIETATEAAFDDKAIVASAATLIRYGKVSEDNLRPALEVMTDLAAKTGDTESAAALLGKALADPAKAAGKLARAGVILTKQQQKQIKAMVKAGDVAGAQTLLLDILSDTTKDAAKNSAGPYRDALNKLGDAGEDLRRSFAIGLLPVIEEVSELLTTELAKPETLNALKGIGSALADTLRSLISSARQLPWGAIGQSLQIAGAGAKAILDAFLGLPPWIQTAVITGWGLNKLSGGLLTNLASGLIKGVLGINAGVVNVNAKAVAGMGGAAGAAGAGGSKSIVSRLGRGLAIFGTVAIAGASIAALAQAFGDFQTTVAESQAALAEKVEKTRTQTFKQTLDNLNATNKNLQGLNAFDEILASVTGGGQITRNFEMAAERIVSAQNLSRSDTVAALDALKDSQQQARELNLSTPTLDAAIKTLAARIAAMPKVGPPKPTTRVSGAGDRPSPGNPGQFAKNLNKIGFEKWVAKAGEIKTAVIAESGAQKAELGNIKNAMVTLDATTTATSADQTSEIARAKQAAATAGRNTSTAARNAGIVTSAATRGVAPSINPAIYSIGNQITRAVNSLDLSVNVTTVNRTSTVNNRYGPTGGSSTNPPLSGELP